MSDALAAARANIVRWRRDPVAFVVENFHVEPQAWQVEALRAFPDTTRPRISLQACVGPGKSAVLAWCGWNFLLCYGDKGHHPNGAAVSITGDNLKDNLWKEFSVWQQQSEVLTRTFTWTQTRIFANDHPSTWFLSARSFSKTASAEDQGRTLSGLHGEFILVLIDESGDIPVAVGKAAEQALSTNPRFIKIMQAGNPTSLEGLLYEAAGPKRNLWFVIRITGDPDDPKRSPRINLEWAKQQIAAYGRENPWVKSQILGQFPDASINALLGIEDVQAAMSRHLRLDQYQGTRKRLGIDAARFGGDPWIIFPRQGLAAFKPVELRNPRTHDVVARVIRAKQAWGDGDPSSVREFFDDTGGYAAGAIDGMIQAGYGPTPINFAGKADDARYYNKRAEMYFRAADWVKRGGALPPDNELLQEAIVSTYTYKGNKFLVEDKEQIRERLGRSPNKWDAFVLTHAEHDEPISLPAALQRQSAHEWNPYETREEPGRALTDWEPQL